MNFLNHPKVVNTALSQARGVYFLVVVWGTMCTYLSNRPGLQRLEFLVKKGLSDAGRTRSIVYGHYRYPLHEARASQR